MATDPEARASGNSGVIIAVVALVLVVGLAIAFMSMRGNEGTTTIVNPPSSTTVVDAPDAAPAPAPAPNVTVVTPPASAPATTGDASSSPAPAGSADAPASSAPAGDQ